MRDDSGSVSNYVTEKNKKVIMWTYAVGSAIAVFGFILVFIVQVNPDILIPLGVFGFPGIIAGVVSLVFYIRILKLKKLPLIAPSEIGLHAGNSVMIDGYASGMTIASPYSNRACVYAEVEHLRTTYAPSAHGRAGRANRPYLFDSERHRRTSHWYPFDSIGALAVVDTPPNPSHRQAVLPIPKGSVTLKHITKEPVAAQNTNSLRGAFLSSSRLREAIVTESTRLWISAVVTDSGQGLRNDKSIQVSGIAVKGQTRSLLVVSLVSIFVTALFFTGFAVYVAAI